MASLIGLDSTSSGFDPGLQDPPVTFGVWGDSGDADGVIGSSNTGVGVFGRSIDTAAAAVRGSSENGTGVEATSVGGTALHARRDPGGGAAVTEAFLATPSLAADFRGDVATTGAVRVNGRLDAAGVVGSSDSGVGVLGQSVDSAATAVKGSSDQGTGVEATSAGGTALHARRDPGGGAAVTEAFLATPSLAADFRGDVAATGVVLLGGRLGVGSTAPRNAVGIRGVGDAEELLSFEDSSGTRWHVNQKLGGQSGLNFAETGVADGRLYLQAGGNVGIGTTAPVAKLEVEGDVRVPHGQLFVTNDKPAAPFGVANAVCATSTNGTAVFASGPTAAIAAIGPSQFTGNVDVSGTFTAGDKRCLIDSPSDPENKTLTHACIESDERFNIYSGNVVLDGNGEARVALPQWVAAFNTDFRYQLTCIGQAAPVYVAQEVSDDAFSIAGGAADMKVSWQLTGVRNDAWARANPLVVEREKPDDEKGFFLHPEAFGQDLTRHTQYKRYEHMIRGYPRQAEQVMRTYDAARKSR